MQEGGDLPERSKRAGQRANVRAPGISRFWSSAAFLPDDNTASARVRVAYSAPAPRPPTTSTCLRDTGLGFGPKDHLKNRDTKWKARVSRQPPLPAHALIASPYGLCTGEA